jgi:hypothetical protein
MHGYLFMAPTVNNGNVNTQTSFGILPPSPTTPGPTPSAGNTFTGGLGFEDRFGPWLGFGLDLAGIAPGGGKVIDTTVGTFSPNLYFHLGKPQRPRRSSWFPMRPQAEGAKLDLYLTGGYTVLFQLYGANAFNVGAGLNYWWGEKRGIMAEYRYVRVIDSNPPVTGSPYSEIRVGFIFRGNP